MIPTTYDRELAQRWIEALESGQYAQGTGHLRNNDNTHCCLGVLCDISGTGTWIAPGEGYEGDNDYYYEFLPNEAPEAGYGSMPPSRLCEQVAITYSGERHDGKEWMPDPTNKLDSTVSLYLPSLNDTGQITFADVAKALRAYYAELDQENA